MALPITLSNGAEYPVAVINQQVGYVALLYIHDSEEDYVLCWDSEGPVYPKIGPSIDPEQSLNLSLECYQFLAGSYDLSEFYAHVPEQCEEDPWICLFPLLPLSSAPSDLPYNVVIPFRDSYILVLRERTNLSIYGNFSERDSLLYEVDKYGFEVRSEFNVPTSEVREVLAAIPELVGLELTTSFDDDTAIVAYRAY